ncbi:MAG: hypothetical protein ABL857_08410 [Rickettsiales bacterium]|jgi:hypothetical protein
MFEIKNNPAIACDDIQMDAAGQADKEKILREQRKNSKLSSVA